MKIHGDTVYIPLTKHPQMKQLYARIDLDDYERVTKSKWRAMPSGRTFYALATSLKYLPEHHRRLHLFVMRAERGQLFDHISGDGLDCRKANLRPATGQQNGFNRQKTNSPHVTSKFKGVMLTKSGRWAAIITKDGERSVLGLFDREDIAAVAYDKAAVKLFGEFAKTNLNMGLFDAETPNTPDDARAREAKFIPPSALSEKPEWQRFLETGDRYLEPPVDRNIRDHRLRRKLAAKARQTA